ncbi:NAD(P)H-dependent flavin oxidoreductase [Georgenia thermotolerans]|uniref:Nitronate monooxygenase n=1 Tax=Georgenia thermotolerans TaxID=527326 RepID=A0A7J5UTG0_9MICO|nr:nitronate monooxygenase family protein [Georgenia thermotolerans]KAE8765575.1 nitronate monooxygenase [Georgenia thermotolerans]
MRTAFTELVGVEHPLVGFNRAPAVVVEVSRAGALGVLGATMYTPEQLDARLTWMDEQLAGRPYGVDLLVPGSVGAVDGGGVPPEHRDFVEGLLADHGIPPLPADAQLDRTGRIDISLETNMDAQVVHELLEVTFSHRVALVASALGTPPPEMVARARAAGVPVAALVGTGEHARRQLAAGVDVLVAQGTEGGGHTGNVATMVLTPEVVDLAGDVPVLAAGGIATGRQLAAALALGAAGAWTGSVWLSSLEDPAAGVIKEKLLTARSTDTVVSPTRTGKPARQLRSAWLDAWGRPGAPSPLPMPWQSTLVREAWERIDLAAEAGDARARELESFFVGQVVGTFTELRPAGEIVRDIVAGCEQRLRELGGVAARDVAG